MHKDSQVDGLVSYSFLVAFANGNHLHKNTLEMLERIALEDGKVDEEEKKALRNIFAHAERIGISQRVQEEMDRFRTQYNI